MGRRGCTNGRKVFRQRAGSLRLPDSNLSAGCGLRRALDAPLGSAPAAGRGVHCRWEGVGVLRGAGVMLQCCCCSVAPVTVGLLVTLRTVSPLVPSVRGISQSGTLQWAAILSGGSS